MKLPNLCDPIDRYLLASGAVSIIDWNGTSVHRAYAVVRDACVAPVTDWDEMWERVLLTSPSARRGVVAEQLHTVHTEMTEWENFSRDLTSRTIRFVSLGQLVSAAVCFIALVAGFLSTTLGHAWAAVPVVILPFGALFVLSFCLSGMERRVVASFEKVSR